MAIDKNLSEYELERLERIAENKRKIAELGLDKRPTEKSKKKPTSPPPLPNLHSVERRISSRDRKTVRHASLAGLDVKGKKGNADTEFVYKKDDDDDEEDEDEEDVVSDDGMPVSRGGRVCKQRQFKFQRSQDVVKPKSRHRLPMPVAPSQFASSLPVAVTADHGLATMLANISNYTFTSTSPFQPSIPLLEDGKLACSVCKGRFIPKQGNIMRQHQDVQYGGICHGSGMQVV